MKRFLLASLVLFAPMAAAQQHPNRDRGFIPNRVYDFSGVDNVNLFNGNLVVTIPIGPVYQVSRTLSYRLTLVHSGNPWSMLRKLSGTDLGNPQEEQYPNPRSNAGLGWRLSLGQFVTPGDPYNSSRGPTPGWVYVTPDGSEHDLGYTSQHALPHLGMRRTTLANGQQLEMADGTTHSFHGHGALREIKDRFGAWVHIDTDDPYRWTITDSAQRRHYVVFAADSTNAYPAIVDYVELAASGGARARYDFTYDTPTIPRACEHSTYYGVPLAVAVPLLKSVAIPESPAYSMTYEHGEFTSACASVARASSGLLKSLTLPTGGQYKWEWLEYAFPQESADAKTLRSAPGVKTRTLSSGGVESTWTYGTSIPDQYSFCTQPKPGGEIYCYWPEVVNTVTAPDGSATKRYFSAFAGGPGNAADNVLQWDSEEYGLNFSRRPSDGATAKRFIASEVMRPGGVVARKEFRLYEGGKLGHLKASRTLFLDDCDAGGTCRYADVEHYNPDGYGRYRQTSTGGNFPGANFRTTFTNHQGPPATGEWVLNTYTEQCSAADPSLRTAAITGCSQLADPSITTFSFDRTTGFLKEKRTLAGSSPGPNDLLTVFTRSASGTIESITESYSGGDLCPLGATHCPTPAYQIVNTYDAGTLSRSKYFGFPFDVVNAALDASTGLARSVFDTAGVEVRYAYDTLGRIKELTPWHTGKTTWHYGTSVPAIVTETLFDNLSVARAEKTWTFDGFGRVTEETVPRGDGGTSTRKTTYDALGRVQTVSELGATGTSPPVTTNTYDVFGRLRTTTAPDGAVRETSYTGDRLVERVVPRALGTTGADTKTYTCEEYDRFGRLHRIHEGVGRTADGRACAASGAISVTTYGYDDADRLVSVRMEADGVTQERLFTYDKRGFLVSEKHPERNSATRYLGYDARGHATRRVDGSDDGPFDLSFQYDGAERLVEVRKTSGQQLLKEFIFGTSNSCSPTSCDWRLGKLWKAIRHNRIDSVNVIVTDAYTYSGPDGRASGKVTTVNDGVRVREFAQSVTHDAFGGIATTTYPACNACGAGPGRTIASDSATRPGFLTAVGNFTAAAPHGITYWPNGVMKTIAHSNNVSERQFIDETTGMARPLRFEVDGFAEPVPCTAPGLSGPSSATIAYNNSTVLSVAASNTDGGAISYVWYRGAAPDQSAPVSDNDGNPATFTTPALTENTSYWVRVTKTCDSGSAAANSVSAAITVRLATPLNVNARPQGQSIRVTWDAVPGATSYTVRRKRAGANFTSYDGAQTPHVDGGVDPFVGYVYRVVANRTHAESSSESAGDVCVLASYTTSQPGRTTPVRGADLSELRQAVDAARTVAGLPRAWSSYLPATGWILAGDWAELHAKLAEARGRLNAAYGVPLAPLGAPPAAGSPIAAQFSITLRGGVE